MCGSPVTLVSDQHALLQGLSQAGGPKGCPTMLRCSLMTCLILGQSLPEKTSTEFLFCLVEPLPFSTPWECKCSTRRRRYCCPSVDVWQGNGSAYTLLALRKVSISTFRGLMQGLFRYRSYLQSNTFRHHFELWRLRDRHPDVSSEVRAGKSLQVTSNPALSQPYSIGKHLALWRSCVCTSALCGLHVAGLGPKHLHNVSLGKLRAYSPAMVMSHMFSRPQMGAAVGDIIQTSRGLVQAHFTCWQCVTAFGDLAARKKYMQ